MILWKIMELLSCECDFCMDFSEIQILGSDSGFRKRLTDTGSTCKPETQMGKFMSGSLSGTICTGMFKQNKIVCGENSL